MAVVTIGTRKQAETGYRQADQVEKVSYVSFVMAGKGEPELILFPLLNRKVEDYAEDNDWPESFGKKLVI